MMQKMLMAKEKIEKLDAMHKELEKMARRKSALAKMPAKQKLKLCAIAASAFVAAGAAVGSFVSVSIVWLLAFYAGLQGLQEAELESMGKGGKKLRQKLLCSESTRRVALCNALLGRAIAARWLDGCKWLLAAACIAKALNMWLASRGFSVPQPLL